MNDVLNQTRNNSIPITASLSEVTTLYNDVKDNSVYKFDETNFKNLTDGVKMYQDNNKERMDFMDSFEGSRNLFNLLIFFFFLLIILISLLCFFKRWPVVLLVLSIVLLFTLPLILFFQGATASYYFVYSDFCDSIHDAMYENQFPVYNKGLGYFLSPFDAKTKATLWTFSWEIDQTLIKLEAEKSKEPVSFAQFQKILEMIKKFTKTRDGGLKDLMQSLHLVKTVEYTENRLCKNGLDWTFSLVKSYTYLFFCILIMAIAVNRMKPLVEKKKNEIEVKFII